MTTLDLFCRCFGWKGGTIHDAKKRFAIASLKKLDRFCGMISDNLWSITDKETAQYFMRARLNAVTLHDRALAYERGSK